MVSHQLFPRVFRIHLKFLGIVPKALHNQVLRNAREERLS